MLVLFLAFDVHVAFLLLMLFCLFFIVNFKCSQKCVVSSKYKGKFDRSDTVEVNEDGKIFWVKLHLLFDFEENGNTYHFAYPKNDVHWSSLFLISIKYTQKWKKCQGEASRIMGLPELKLTDR
jgi:hypothetical protein